MADRRIIVMDGEKKVYEGPENRYSHNIALVQPNRVFGLALDTWIKMVGFIIGVTVFYIQTTDFMKAQMEINTYIMDYTKNSDAYHSAQTGFVFKQGAPTGNMLRNSSTRTLQQEVSNAR